MPYRLSQALPYLWNEHCWTTRRREKRNTGPKFLCTLLLFIKFIKFRKGILVKYILLTTAAVVIILSGCGQSSTENDQPFNLSTAESVQLNNLLTEGLQRSITLDVAKREYINSIHKLADAVNEKASPPALLDAYIQASIADLNLKQAFQDKYKLKAKAPEDLKIFSRDDIVEDHRKLVQNFLESQTFFNTEWKKAISKITAYKDLSNDRSGGYVGYLWDLSGLTQYTLGQLWQGEQVQKLEAIKKIFSEAEQSLLRDLPASENYAKPYLLENPDRLAHKALSREAKVIVNNIWDKLKRKGFSGYVPIPLDETVVYNDDVSTQVAMVKGKNPQYDKHAYPDLTNTVLKKLFSWSDHYLVRASRDARVRYNEEFKRAGYYGEESLHPSKWSATALAPGSVEKYSRWFLESLIGLQFKDKYFMEVVDEGDTLNRRKYVLSSTYRDIEAHPATVGGVIVEGDPFSGGVHTFYFPAPPAIQSTDEVIPEATLKEWSQVFIDVLKEDPYFKPFFETPLAPADASGSISALAALRGASGIDAIQFTVNGISGSQIDLEIPMYIRLKGSVDQNKSTALNSGFFAYSLGNTVLGVIQSYANSGEGFNGDSYQSESSIVAAHSFGLAFVEVQVGSVWGSDINRNNWSGVRSQSRVGINTPLGAPFIQVTYRDFGEISDKSGYIGFEIANTEFKIDTYTFSASLLTKVGHHSVHGLTGSIDWTSTLNLKSGVSVNMSLNLGSVSEDKAEFNLSIMW